MVSFVVYFVRFVRRTLSQWRDPRVRHLVWTVGMLFISGTVFYHRVENWRWLDSFYFSVIVLTTVGLGDFTPQTDIGKLFTVLYLLIGIGTLLAFINASVARTSMAGVRKTDQAEGEQQERFDANH